ncbi:ArsR/SmtB family transcription factor [Candidatus Latescibacterota bacterium]
MLLKKIDFEKLEMASEIFKAFGNPIRIRIIDALLDKPLRVMELAELLDYPQPIISQQLKILRSVGIVKKIMEGRIYHYALTNQHYSQMVKCMKGCLGI